MVGGDRSKRCAPHPGEASVELVVQADPDDLSIILKVGIVASTTATATGDHCYVEGVLTKVVVEVFGLGADLVSQGVFDAGADCVAGLHGTLGTAELSIASRSEHVDGMLRFAVGKAARGVEES